MDRSEIRSLLHDVIAVETEPFSVRVATLASAIDRIEAALRAARAEGIEEAAKVARDRQNDAIDHLAREAGGDAYCQGSASSAAIIEASIRALLTKESDDE